MQFDYITSSLNYLKHNSHFTQNWSGCKHTVLSCGMYIHNFISYRSTILYLPKKKKKRKNKIK